MDLWDILLAQLCSIEGNSEKNEIVFELLSELIPEPLKNKFFLKFLDIYMISNPSKQEEIHLGIIFQINEDSYFFIDSENNDRILLFKNYVFGDPLNFIYENISRHVNFSNHGNLIQFKVKNNNENSLENIIKEVFNEDRISISSRSINFSELERNPNFRKKLVKIKDLALNFNFIPDNYNANFLKFIIKKLHQKIGILEEDRGLLNFVISTDKKIGLKEIIRELFKLKLSHNSEERLSFQTIQKDFTVLFEGMEFDLVLEKINLKDKVDPILLLDKKSDNPYKYEDYRLTLRYNDEDLIAIEPTLIFYSKKDQNFIHKIDQAPGGAYETIMVLTILRLPEVTTNLLDEPGRTIHPVL